MVTRIIENTILDDDPHMVENWIERLNQAIDIAIFNSEDKLPADHGERTARIYNIKRSYLLSSLGTVSYIIKVILLPSKARNEVVR